VFRRNALILSGGTENFDTERYIKGLFLARCARRWQTYNRNFSRYKSQGEQRIADFLTEQKIKFDYEYPLAIRDRGQVRIWYPDFRLPEYGMILEYFGMNGNAAYNEQIAHKIQTYQTVGVEGIYLLESSFYGDWQEQILGRIEQTLEGKLRRIRSVNQGTHSAQDGS
jgi:hypothetical protein